MYYMGKIAKKDIGDRLLVSPNWISNGHWAVFKRSVRNVADFLSADVARAAFRLKSDQVSELADERMDEIIAAHKTSELVAFQRTGIILAGDNVKHLRVFRNHAAVKLIDECMVELFGLQTVTSTTDPLKAVFITDDNEDMVLVMPCRENRDSDFRRELLSTSRMIMRTPAEAMPFGK